MLGLACLPLLLTRHLLSCAKEREEVSTNEEPIVARLLATCSRFHDGLIALCLGSLAIPSFYSSLRCGTCMRAWHSLFCANALLRQR